MNKSQWKTSLGKNYPLNQQTAAELPIKMRSSQTIPRADLQSLYNQDHLDHSKKMNEKSWETQETTKALLLFHQAQVERNTTPIMYETHEGEVEQPKQIPLIKIN